MSKKILRIYSGITHLKENFMLNKFDSSHFFLKLDSCGIPLKLYNIPIRAHVKLQVKSTTIFVRAKEHKNYATAVSGRNFSNCNLALEKLKGTDLHAHLWKKLVFNNRKNTVSNSF